MACRRFETPILLAVLAVGAGCSSARDAASPDASESAARDSMAGRRDGLVPYEHEPEDLACAFLSDGRRGSRDDCEDLPGTWTLSFIAFEGTRPVRFDTCGLDTAEVPDEPNAYAAFVVGYEPPSGGMLTAPSEFHRGHRCATGTATVQDDPSSSFDYDAHFVWTFHPEAPPYPGACLARRDDLTDAEPVRIDTKTFLWGSRLPDLTADPTPAPSLVAEQLRYPDGRYGTRTEYYPATDHDDAFTWHDLDGDGQPETRAVTKTGDPSGGEFGWLEITTWESGRVVEEHSNARTRTLTKRTIDEDGDGVIDRSITFAWLHRGLQEERIDEGNDGTQDAVRTVRYNRRQRVLWEEFDGDMDGAPERRTEYTYDALGNLLHERTWQAPELDAVQAKQQTEYDYACWTAASADTGDTAKGFDSVGVMACDLTRVDWSSVAEQGHLACQDEPSGCPGEATVQVEELVYADTNDDGQFEAWLTLASTATDARGTAETTLGLDVYRVGGDCDLQRKIVHRTDSDTLDVVVRPGGVRLIDGGPASGKAAEHTFAWNEEGSLEPVEPTATSGGSNTLHE
ncbi:MAG: hypothetical protein OXU20_17525 [Myxococcales bacterium]|nr:hypothetical protein [Myxococcales bacterium]